MGFSTKKFLNNFTESTFEVWLLALKANHL